MNLQLLKCSNRVKGYTFTTVNMKKKTGLKAKLYNHKNVATRLKAKLYSNMGKGFQCKYVTSKSTSVTQASSSLSIRLSVNM